jgi:hypothetical protein
MSQLATVPNWSQHWSRAYEYGHNVLRLRNGRLTHFANAYADIAEEAEAVAPELEMTLEAFALQWERGDYFGTWNEHWVPLTAVR